jgi:hypothetical protein
MASLIEECPMMWLFVALVTWTVIAIAGGLLIGAVTALAERQERAERAPVFVPDDWSLTPTR